MTNSLSAPAERWYSGQPTQTVITTALATGQVVIAERRPFRVDRVAELPLNEWPEQFVTAWRERGQPEAAQWWDRPYKVTGLWEGPGADDRLHHTIAPAGHRWDVLPEHYAVCHRCGELPPCSHVHNERISAAAIERMEENLAILPGACHGCHEPITSRQKSFSFPGPNLVRPDLGDDSAIFHTRRQCYGALTAYDKRWAAAEADRTRLFFCEGMRTWHYDGTGECDRPDCTGKGEMASLVDHRVSIWHRPGTPERHFDAMRAFGHNSGQNNATCWCLNTGGTR